MTIATKELTRGESYVDQDNLEKIIVTAVREDLSGLGHYYPTLIGAGHSIFLSSVLMSKLGDKKYEKGYFFSVEANGPRRYNLIDAFEKNMPLKDFVKYLIDLNDRRKEPVECLRRIITMRPLKQ